MMRRRIFLWMGLIVLFATVGLSRTGLARVTHQIQSGDARVGIPEKADAASGSPKAVGQSRNGKSGHSRVTSPPKAKKTVTRVKASPPRKEIYSVRKGDSLARIAKNAGVSVAELRDLNHLKGNFLKTGQKLTLYQRPESKSVPAVAEYANNGPVTDLEEEEEGDGGIVSKEVLAEMERQKKESKSLLGNWSNPDEPKLLVKVAMGFLGAPYRLGGSSVTGIDCSAFVKNIYQVFNITLPRTAYEQSHVGLRVARGELIEGDLLFFDTRRKLGHVGIYIGNNEFVHASSRKRGVRIDNLNTPYFDRRFVKAVRLKGSDDGL